MTEGCRAPGRQGGRGPRRWWAAAWPAPPALPRTGAGRCRNAVSPGHSPRRAPAVTPPGDRTCTSSRAVLLAPGIVPSRKDHQQGRSSLRPSRRLLRKRRPLPDDLARQETGTRREDGRNPRPFTLGAVPARSQPTLALYTRRLGGRNDWTGTLISRSRLSSRLASSVVSCRRSCSGRAWHRRWTAAGRTRRPRIRRCPVR